MSSSGCGKSNHYPLLKKAREKGDIISIKAETPRFHSGEETRWDFRVTVVFKDVRTAFDEGLVTPYKKQLFPDLDALGKSEQPWAAGIKNCDSGK